MIELKRTTEALTEGTQLWVLPQLEKSSWAKRLDWYLNFQLQKAQERESQNLASEKVQESAKDVKALNEKTDSPSDSNTNSKSSLLIESQKLLPNKMTLQLSFQDSIESWIAQIIEKSLLLKQSRVRVFLPQKIKFDQVKSLHLHQKSSLQIEIIEDSFIQ